ncbi:MAG: hypothetical protein K1X53_07200 [Candidatus Sumerlaeaceae bacterium]|nr:hypothetical protein [Candidatus Sumerlaeaceae bacterium]
MKRSFRIAFVLTLGLAAIILPIVGYGIWLGNGMLKTMRAQYKEKYPNRRIVDIHPVEGASDAAWYYISYVDSANGQQGEETWLLEGKVARQVEIGKNLSP